MTSTSKITEGLEPNDLKRLVHDVIHIDEYTSKMGENKDIVTVSFRVKTREPANDLVGWFERGYDFILDAEISPGEMDDGYYLVFIEIERKRAVVPQLLLLLGELSNIVDFEDWRYVYFEGDKKPVTPGNLQTDIPLSPRQYRLLREPEEPIVDFTDNEQTEESVDLELDEEVKQWQDMAGVKRTSNKDIDEDLKQLQAYADIKTR